MGERHPHVVVADDALVFHDASVFVSPQPISRADIEHIAMGPGVSQQFKTKSVWRGPGPVVVSPDPDVPNAVVTFKAPTRLENAYVPFTLYRMWIGRPPIAAEPLGEVWIPFADPARSYRTLARWAPTRWVEGK